MTEDDWHQISDETHTWTSEQKRIKAEQVARIFDVPVWLIDPSIPPPRWRRIWWRIRRLVTSEPT